MKTVLANTIDSLECRKGAMSDCREIMRRCGANTGNVCFVDAIYEQLIMDKEVGCLNIDADEEDALFVLPAANWINPKGELLYRIFNRLENADVKLLVLGIGVQMGLQQSVNDFVASISQEAVKALKILSEHSVSIGVRGEVTAEVLDKLGIHNWQVIGCPSYYEPYRKKQFVGVCRPTLDKVMYGITPRTENVHKLLELAMRSEQSVCLQSMLDLPLTLTEGKEIDRELLEERYPGADMEAWELEEYIHSHGCIFYNRKAWAEYLVKNKYTFAVGTRFHGNMMAFTNGIPALWVVHDVRTKEMVQAMRLPFIYASQLANITTPEQLIELWEGDSDFGNYYNHMGEEYVDFLNRNGISHTFGK